MPKHAYLPVKNFSSATWDVIHQADAFVTDYMAEGYTLTLRQLYYQFVSEDLFPNTEQSYNRLKRIVSDARLCGLLDWDGIEDRGRNTIRHAHWDNPADIVSASASQFRFDLWEHQTARVEVWVEKDALVSVIGNAAGPLDVPHFACKGYTSQSAMWRASERFKAWNAAGQRVVVIHLGDHDPSGIDMTRDNDERLVDTFGADVTVQRVALNMDQVRQYNPPKNPAKLTDSRVGNYLALYGAHSWELDALKPQMLVDLVDRSIREHMDEDQFDEDSRRQSEARELLTAVSDNWDHFEGQARELLEGSQG